MECTTSQVNVTASRYQQGPLASDIASNEFNWSFFVGTKLKEIFEANLTGKDTKHPRYQSQTPTSKTSNRINHHDEIVDNTINPDNNHILDISKDLLTTGDITVTLQNYVETGSFALKYGYKPELNIFTGSIAKNITNFRTYARNLRNAAKLTKPNWVANEASKLGSIEKLSKIGTGLAFLNLAINSWEAYNKGTTGGWVRLGFQGAITGISLIPGGQLIALGLTGIDLIWGDDIEEGINDSLRGLSGWYTRGTLLFPVDHTKVFKPKR